MTDEISPPSKGLGSAAAIFDETGRILLVKHAYGRFNWELPGGLGERCESPMDTAVREVREETGLHVTVRALTGCYYEPLTDLVLFVFRCVVHDGNRETSVQRAEISQCVWWPTYELPRPISDFTVRRIEDAEDGGNNLPIPVIVGERRWLE